jgi:hypothetical protein
VYCITNTDLNKLQRNPIRFLRTTPRVRISNQQSRQGLHSPGVWITCCESFFERRVIAIDIIEEPNLVFLVHSRRTVHDQNRDTRSEINLKVIVIAIHAGLHALQIPTGIVSKNPRNEISRLVHPNAAVTEIASILRKQFRLVRPVEIYIVRIRENDLYKTERIRWPWLLPHHQVPRFKSLQNLGADSIFCHYLAFCGNHLEILFRYVVGILLDVRYETSFR